MALGCTLSGDDEGDSMTRTRIGLGIAVSLAVALACTSACSSPAKTGSSKAPADVGDSATARPAEPETLYQWSTLSALTIGLYQPAVTVGEIKQRGNTGIGTFTALDGEMIELDGVVYQVRADGSVHESPDASSSPFAAVTTFSSDRSFEMTGAANYDALKQAIDAQITGVNDIRVVRIAGHFDYIKTRSVPRQTEPYPPLAQVTAHQPEFEFRDVDGVLVGVWCPAWVGQINVPGYHFHFLTADKSGGGHVLEVTMGKAAAQVDVTPGFNLSVPQTPEFEQVDLAGDYQKQIDAAEK